MQTNSNNIRILGAVLFLIGLFLVLLMAIIAIWPDLEASMFDAALPAEERLRTLACPVIVTADEVGEITASFTNPGQRPVQFPVRARITEGRVTLVREVESQMEIAPGATEVLSWPVTAEDAAYRRLILARIYSFRSSPMPSMRGACGILVVGVSGLSGAQVTTFLLVGGLLALGVGSALWLVNNQPLTGLRREVTLAFGLLAVTILAAMVVGLLGLWGVGVLLLALVVLLVAVMLERYLLSR